MSCDGRGKEACKAHVSFSNIHINTYTYFLFLFFFKEKKRKERYKRIKMERVDVKKYFYDDTDIFQKKILTGRTSSSALALALVLALA